MAEFNCEEFEESAQELFEKIEELVTSAETLLDPECYSNRASRLGQLAEIQSLHSEFEAILKKLVKQR